VCFNNPDVLATLCSNIHQVKLRRASSYQLPQQRSKALSRFGKIQASIMFLKAVKASTAGGSSDKPEVDFASFARAISLPNSNGNTCLHLAVARRNTEVLSKFLDFLSEFGLSSRLLCVADHNGETPLHFACRQGSIEDIIVLLLHGARVGVEADSGATAEDMLRQCVSKHSERKDVMQLLIMLGPVLQKENREYELFLEQQQGSLTIFNTQVEFCQVLSKKRRIGIGLPPVFELITLMPSLVSYCPSLIASSDWIMGLVRDGDAGELIKQVENIGETVDSFIGMTDPDGNTLLHKAVEYRHLDIALIFLESGIDAAKTNLFGISSVHMAASQGLPDFYFSIMSSLLNFDFVFKGRHNIMDLAAAGGSLHILNSLHSLGGAFADDLGNSCGVLESAVQHQQFATSMYAACQVPFSSRSSAMLLEIKDFILKLEDRKSNWSILIEASTEIDFRTGLQAKVKEANGLMVAQSLASRDSSALWRHLSDDHWQSLAKWQSQDEHRHSLVFYFANIVCSQFLCLQIHALLFLSGPHRGHQSPIRSSEHDVPERAQS
jgi:ankyrin repeat protein